MWISPLLLVCRRRASKRVGPWAPGEPTAPVCDRQRTATSVLAGRREGALAGSIRLVGMRERRWVPHRYAIVYINRKTARMESTNRPASFSFPQQPTFLTIPRTAQFNFPIGKVLLHCTNNFVL